MKKRIRLVSLLLVAIIVCALCYYLYQWYVIKARPPKNGILQEYEIKSLNSVETDDIASFIKNKINSSFDENDYIVEKIICGGGKSN